MRHGLRSRADFNEGFVPTPIIIVHDGAIDEFMSIVLVTTVPAVKLLGQIIVNADCIAAPVMFAAWKIMNYLGKPESPIGLSHARGANAFPWDYRSDCVRENNLDVLLPNSPAPQWPPFPDGDALLKQLIKESNDPVTLLVTSPLTPVANLLLGAPQLASNIARIVWMGGAIGVPGNLDPGTLPTPPRNAYAEWNAFWDPFAVQQIITETKIPLTVVPLDATDGAQITPVFMRALKTAAMRYRIARLAYDSYSLVSNEPFYDMWDVVTTCFVVRPDLFLPPRRLRVAVEVEWTSSQGALRVVPSTQVGREADIVFNFVDDGTKFYQFVTEQFSRDR
jgi:purine nucleosidase